MTELSCPRSVSASAVFRRASVLGAVIATVLAMTGEVRAGERLFLGELVPESVHVGWDQYRVNRNLNDQPVLLGGERCERFLLAHAPSRITFLLPEGATRFTATGLTSQEPGIWGAWFYEVWIDGELKFRSPSLENYPRKEIPIAVDIPDGAKRITLLVDDQGNNQRDHSIWA